MAISFVGAKSGSSASTTAFAVSLTDLLDTGGASVSPATDDDVIICWSVASSSDKAPTAPTGWTEIENRYKDGTTYDTNLVIWAKRMGATPDTTVSLPGSGNTSDSVAYTVHCLRGIDATTRLDVASTYADGLATTNGDPAAITPSTAGAWIMVAMAGAAQTSTNYSLPADLSATTNHFQKAIIADSNDPCIGVGIKTNWSSGAFDPGAWSGGAAPAAGSWSAVTLAFRPATAGAISGSSAPAFSISGTLTGKGALAGSSSPAFTGTGTASGRGALAGTSSPVFATSATVTGRGALAGSSGGVFSASGAVTGRGALAGQSSWSFSLTGQLSEPLGRIRGIAGLSFAGQGLLIDRGLAQLDMRLRRRGGSYGRDWLRVKMPRG
jgi:hypothetical protein